jgi:ATP-dependent DNA ligase
MTNFLDIIKACEKAEGGGSKLAIREALSEMDDIAHGLIWEALNKYRVYYVSDFDMPPKNPAKAIPPGALEAFFHVLSSLCDRKVTGNAARNSVTNVISLFPTEWHEYLKRVVLGDLKAGFSADTVNKVLLAREMQDNTGDSLDDCLKAIDKLLKVEGWYQFRDYKIYPKLIPTYEVQLASKCETEEEFEENTEYPCQADVKYDGERNGSRVILGQPVVHYSRSGNIAEHMAGLFDEQLGWLREQLGYDFMMDGERLSRDFTGTMNAKGGDNHEAKKRLIIRAYFLMPLEDWIRQKTDITMKQSRELLLDVLGKLKDRFGEATRIFPSEGKIVNNHQEMMEFCDEVIDGHFNGRKEEGLILKKLNDVYRWERNLAWIKVKRFYPVDLRCIGWYFGNIGSRNEKRMGGVILEGVDEKGKKIRARCGSGFNPDTLRDDPDFFKEKTLEIDYQEMTQSSKMKGTDIYSLRFLTVSKIRTDKDVPALQGRRLWGVSLKEAVKFVNEGK